MNCAVKFQVGMFMCPASMEGLNYQGASPRLLSMSAIAPHHEVRALLRACWPDAFGGLAQYWEQTRRSSYKHYLRYLSRSRCRWLSRFQL
jgi:hypothetical protein